MMALKKPFVFYFSGQNAQEAGRLAKFFADKSWMFAQKQIKINEKKLNSVPVLGPLTVSVDSLSPKAQKMHKEVTEFVRELIIPKEKELIGMVSNKMSTVQYKQFLCYKHFSLQILSKHIIFIKTYYFYKKK